jgi:hypothetical protein
MPIIVTEKIGSPTEWTLSDNPSGTFVYIIKSEKGDDEDNKDEILYNDALSALIEKAPEFIKMSSTKISGGPGWDLFRQSISVEAVDDYLWTGTVKYGLSNVIPEESEVIAPSYQFDTTGNTLHITNSILTRGQYASGNRGIQYYDRLINTSVSEKNEDGTPKAHNVDGIDITVPCYIFSETYQKIMTETYAKVLMELTGKINCDWFKNFEKGEILFLGASGSRRNSANVWEITYKFSVMPNKRNFIFDEAHPANFDQIALKEGWDYLWVNQETDPETKLPIITQVNIEQVYEYGDFSRLEISFFG